MSVVEPFRLRILKRLSALLETIPMRDPKTGTQLTQTFAGNVFRGRDAFGDNDPLPMLSILEPPLPIDQLPTSPTNKNSTGSWDIVIQGFLEDDHTNPTDPAHFVMADVKALLVAEKLRPLPGAMGTTDPFGFAADGGRGNVVTGITSIGPGVVRPPESGVSNKAYFWLTVTLKISEDIANPFV